MISAFVYVNLFQTPRIMKKTVYILLIACLCFWIGCKPKKAPVKVEVSQQDTVVAKIEPVAKPIVEIDRGVNLDDRYFLIFNSYTVEEFAQGWSKTYAKKGYKPGIVIRNENGYYCLALESYNDMKLAKEAMTRLREEPGLEEVWIMAK